MNRNLFLLITFFTVGVYYNTNCMENSYNLGVVPEKELANVFRLAGSAIEKKNVDLTAKALIKVSDLMDVIFVAPAILFITVSDTNFIDLVIKKFSLLSTKNFFHYFSFQDKKEKGINHKKVKSKKNRKKVKITKEQKIQLNNRLLEASYKGDLKEMFRLIKCGANLNATSKIGRTPLHYAVAGCKLEAVKFLMLVGTNPLTKTNLNITPLHLISTGEYDEDKTQDAINITQVLLFTKGLLEQKTNKGWTALHIAAAHNNEVMVKVLVNFGANIKALTNKHETPLDLAKQYENKEIIEYLSRIQ